MVYYHGSVVPDIVTLRPHAKPTSKLSRPCVYLSRSPVIASIYIWPRPYMWHTFGFDTEEKPIYTESFPDSLHVFYGGISGYLYRCDVEEELPNPTGISCAAISEFPVPVASCETVPNAYEQLLRYEQEGRLTIHRFATLSEEQHRSNHDMTLGAIRGLDLLAGQHPLSGFVRETFPEVWRRAEQENNG